MEPMYYIDPAPSALCLLNRRRFESAERCVDHGSHLLTPGVLRFEVRQRGCQITVP